MHGHITAFMVAKHGVLKVKKKDCQTIMTRSLPPPQNCNFCFFIHPAEHLIHFFYLYILLIRVFFFETILQLQIFQDFVKQKKIWQTMKDLVKRYIILYNFTRKLKQENFFFYKRKTTLPDCSDNILAPKGFINIDINYTMLSFSVSIIFRGNSIFLKMILVLRIRKGKQNSSLVYFYLGNSSRKGPRK